MIYLRRKNQTAGPFPLSEVRDGLARKELCDTDEYSLTDDGPWFKLTELPEEEDDWLLASLSQLNNEKPSLTSQSIESANWPPLSPFQLVGFVAAILFFAAAAVIQITLAHTWVAVFLSLAGTVVFLFSTHTHVRLLLDRARKELSRTTARLAAEEVAHAGSVDVKDQKMALSNFSYVSSERLLGIAISFLAPPLLVYLAVGSFDLRAIAIAFGLGFLLLAVIAITKFYFHLMILFEDRIEVFLALLILGACWGAPTLILAFFPPSPLVSFACIFGQIIAFGSSVKFCINGMNATFCAVYYLSWQVAIFLIRLVVSPVEAFGWELWKEWMLTGQ
jgi:MFS family permease